MSQNVNNDVSMNPLLKSMVDRLPSLASRVSWVLCAGDNACWEIMASARFSRHIHSLCRRVSTSEMAYVLSQVSFSLYWGISSQFSSPDTYFYAFWYA